MATIENELYTIHDIFWDGTPEDRLYAWYKVRMILIQREGQDNKIDVVNRKIASLDKSQMLSTMEISPEGLLIDSTLFKSMDTNAR